MEEILKQILEKVNRIDAIEQKVNKIDDIEQDVKDIKMIQSTLKLDINVLSEAINKNQEQTRKEFNRRFDNIEIRLDDKVSKIQEVVEELKIKVG